MRLSVLCRGLVLMISTSAFAQTVTIVDSVTRAPLSGVTIVSHGPPASTTTDGRGQADLRPFSGSDSIFISHVGYRTERFSYDDLRLLHQPVELIGIPVPLSEVTISARRTDQVHGGSSRRVERIEASQIAFQSPQTTADALALSGYIHIQKSQLAGGSPMVRGFAANRVLLVVDGVRMNNAIFRSGNVHSVISIDPVSLQSASVLFGPGGVAFGSDAIGGVLNFATTVPGFEPDGPRLSGTAFARHSTATSEKTFHSDVHLGLPSLASVTSITLSDFGDLVAGSHGHSHFLRPTVQTVAGGSDVQTANTDERRQTPSAYHQINFLQKIRFQPDPLWEVEYGFHYSTTSDAARYDRLTLDADRDDTLDFAEWYYGPQRWFMNRLGLSTTRRTLLFDHFELTAAIQNSEESRHARRTNDPWRRTQIETVEAYSLRAEFAKQVEPRLVMTYGAEALLNTVGSKAFQTNGIAPLPWTTRYPDGSTSYSYNAFALTTYAPGDDHTFNAGLRFSFFGLDAEFDTTRFPFPFRSASVRQTEVSASLGMRWNAGTWVFTANGSTGFRGPNIDDVGKVFESEPGFLVVPNPSMKAERAISGEMRAEKRFGDDALVEVSTYYTVLSDAMARRDFSYNGQDSILYGGVKSRVQAIQNIASASVFGVEAGVGVRIAHGLHLRSTFSFQTGTERESGGTAFPLRHSAPPFGSLHMVYDGVRVSFSLFMLYQLGMGYDDLPLSERRDPHPYAKDVNGLPFVPAWWTLNLKGSMSVSRHFSIVAGVENLFDRLYRPFGSGISAPGRNFMATVRGSI